MGSAGARLATERGSSRTGFAVHWSEELASTTKRRRLEAGTGGSGAPGSEGAHRYLDYKGNLLEKGSDQFFARFPELIVALDKFVSDEDNFVVPLESGVSPSHVPTKLTQFASAYEFHQAKVDAAREFIVSQRCVAEKPDSANRELLEAMADDLSSLMRIDPPTEPNLPPIPPNPVTKRILDAVHPLVTESIDLLGVLKLWIQLHKPKIEDGNSFNLTILEECADLVQQTESSSTAFLENATKIYRERASSLKRVVRHPHIMDHFIGLEEADELDIMTLRICLQELRNDFLVLLDTLSKNVSKIERLADDRREGDY